MSVTDQPIRAKDEQAPTFRLEHLGKLLVVIPLPELNKTHWGRVDEAGRQLIDEFIKHGIRSVVVDFSELTFCGSAIVALLVRLWQVVKKHAGTLTCCGVAPEVLEVLTITHLDTLWEICDTREEAIRLGKPRKFVPASAYRVLFGAGVLALVGFYFGLVTAIWKGTITEFGFFIFATIMSGWVAMVVGVVLARFSEGRSRQWATAIVMASIVSLVVGVVVFVRQVTQPSASAVPTPSADSKQPSAASEPEQGGSRERRKARAEAKKAASDAKPDTQADAEKEGALKPRAKRRRSDE